MHLEGWVNPLPDWIVACIKVGKLTIHQAKGYQYLQGTVTNPEGTLVIFL